MANEAISPYQQFIDDGKRVLARGTILFFTDSGLLTSKQVYSDSDLTTAYTLGFTYELDDFGQIRGDAHYDGQATLVISNEAGLEIRQLDEVTVTNDGSLGGITVYKESVADMVADQSLEVGKIIRTQGYFAGNLFGGARYEIVAAATGTVDGYLYHGLGNGLQASLLNREDNRSFLVAGARGDGGTNDTVAMQSVITQGGNIIVEGGFIFTATNLSISTDVRFIGSGGLKQLGSSSGDLFQITSTDVRFVKFRGVTIDGNQVNGNSSNASVGWVIS